MGFKKFFLIAGLSLMFGALPAIAAGQKPAATATARKGPIQITLELYSTKARKHTRDAKPDQWIWYRIKLKNVGKQKFLADDMIFKDPWAIYKNCEIHYGVYLELISPQGDPMPLNFQHPGEIHYDFMPKPGEPYRLNQHDADEIRGLLSQWKRQGLTPGEITVKYSQWSDRWFDRQVEKEMEDPAKQLWLAPGASTETLAWSYHDPDESSDQWKEEPEQAGYAQLWSYPLWDAGRYRIRAVYDLHPARLNRHPSPEEVKVVTPFIPVEVSR